MDYYFFRYLPCLVLFSIILQGCSKEEIIPEDEFIKIYVDLLITQDTTSANPLPLDSLQSIVFIRHHVNFEQYSTTIDFYNSSPEKWEQFFNKAIAYVEELNAKNEE